MTAEEYHLKHKELILAFESHKSNLARDYAYSTNPYKIGDIVTDHIGAIKIERIKFTMGWNSIGELPSCVYVGIELKKDGTPTKKQNKRVVYQKNIINL
jgi:hypothetical protein